MKGVSLKMDNNSVDNDAKIPDLPSLVAPIESLDEN